MTGTIPSPSRAVPWCHRQGRGVSRPRGTALRDRSSFYRSVAQAAVALTLVLGLGHPVAFAQAGVTGDLPPGAAKVTPEFSKTSLTLRTALHYDPAAELPLQKLVDLYRSDGRLEELPALYLTHLAQFPQDLNARVVLARLYLALQDRRAADFLKAALAQYPDHALLARLQALWLSSEHDPKSIDMLARAVALEQSPARRAVWFGELVKTASTQAREDLVLEALETLLREGAMSPEQRLHWAQQTLRTGLMKSARLLMEGLEGVTLGPDREVELLMLRAEIAAADGKKEEPGQELDALLNRLAPDYWRRQEVLRLRLDLAGNEGRQRMVEAARKQWAGAGGATVANALTFAEVLESAHRRSEALALLQKAVAQFPSSAELEARLFTLWEQQGVSLDAVRWLEEKLTRQPERADLRSRLVRWLYAAGQNDRAAAAFDVCLASMAEAGRLPQSLDLARWLRRRNQWGEAATILESVLKKAPHQWELRRELGELYLAQRRPEALKTLFAGHWSDNLPPDARLEVAQFLLAHHFWLEARDLILPWLVREPGAFEGLLLLARIHEKLGEDGATEAVLEKARTLCDTPVRFQAWLGTAMEYAQPRNRAGAWIEREASRLAPTGQFSHDEVSIERWLALLEEAEKRDENQVLDKMLATALSSAALPKEKRLPLERLRLARLAANPERTAETESGLKRLLEEDPAHREDYLLRHAMLCARAGRGDLTLKLIEGIDLGKVSDPGLLTPVVTFCMEHRALAPALAGVERLTCLEPGVLAHWSRWTNFLALSGREPRLRQVLREMLARAPGWGLSPGVTDDIRQHLIASQWRSVLVRLNEGGPGRWAAARREAAELLPLDLLPDQRLWAEWLIACLSLRLGDEPAVQDGLAKLGSVDPGLWVPFPDGMELSAAAMKEALLVHENILETPAARRGDEADLCLPPFEMGWGFALEPGTRITRLVGSETCGMVYFLDDRHALYAVDLHTGKLQWSVLPGGTPLASKRSRSSGSAVDPRPNGTDLRVSMELVVQDDRVCLLEDDQVICFDARTGKFLWKNDLLSANALSPLMSPVSRLAALPGKVVVWQPGCATVSAIDLNGGRLLWQALLPEPPREAPGPQNNWREYDGYLGLKSGVNADGDRIFIYAHSAATLRATDGALLWRLGTGQVPSFPIQLRTGAEKDAAAANAATAQYPPNLVASFTGTEVAAQEASPDLSGLAAQRWGYANNLRALLQGPGHYCPHAMLSGNQIWAVSGDGYGVVSSLGLSQGAFIHRGMVIGQAAASLVSFDGVCVYVSAAVRPHETLRLALMDSKEDPPLALSAEMAGAAVSGSRVHASFGSRLQVMDARSGSRIYEETLPPEAESWRQKVLADEGTVSSIAGYYLPWRAESGSQRTYLPSGVLHQDGRGGGTLCASTALVLGRSWIVPASDRAVLCIRGAAPPPAAAASSPAAGEIISSTAPSPAPPRS